jgi:hypothetical protein
MKFLTGDREGDGAKETVAFHTATATKILALRPRLVYDGAIKSFDGNKG